MKKKVNPHIGGTQQPLFTPDSAWQVPAAPPDLTGVVEVALDTETRDDSLNRGTGPGWAFGNGHLCGISVAWAWGATYLPIRHLETNCLDRDVVRRWLKRLYESNTRLIFHNAPYDLGWIWREFDLLPPSAPGRLDDTGLMAVMVDEGRSGFTLDDLCAWQGLAGKDESLLRVAAAAYCVDPKKDLWKLPARFIAPYAQQDAELTLQLAGILIPMLEAEGTLAAYRTDADLMACCFEMRRRGIRVDTLKAEKGIALLKNKCNNLLLDMSHRLGRKVTLENVRSWKWMAAACDEVSVNYPRTQVSKRHDGSYGGGGQPSFSSDWMRTHPHWLPQMACMVDRMTEGADKFLGNYIKNFAHKGRIHPNINQFKGETGGTRSHRFSYSDPPLQQAPGSKMEELDDLGALIVSLFRGSFLPEEGEVWCSPDISQQEYRLIIHYAYLNNLPKADAAVAKYRSDPTTDFHNFTVELTGLTRRRAKDCSFGKAFGAGINKFALMTGMTVDEAAAAMEQYDREMPFVSMLNKQAKRLADERGYIKLIDGARMHYNLWEPNYRNKDETYVPPLELEQAQTQWPDRRLRRAFTHKAMNNLIQGSAARQTKHAMLLCWREGIVPVLQMHDELPVSVSSPDKGARVAELLCNAVKLEVPVVSDVEYGPTWGDARKVKDAQKNVLYGATFDEALRLAKEGKWWS